MFEVGMHPFGFLHTKIDVFDRDKVEVPSMKVNYTRMTFCL